MIRSLLEQEKAKDSSVLSLTAASNEVDNDDSNSNTTYTVGKGDTLMTVSLKCNITIPTLKKFNRLYGRNSLYTGQVLQLKDPALQPSTWKNTSSDTLNERAIVSSSLSNEGVTDSHNAFMKLKDAGKKSSFFEKEKLKVKALSLHFDVTQLEEDDDEAVVTAALLEAAKTPVRLQRSGSSFRYKCSSHPDLASLDQSERVDEDLLVSPRSQSIFMRERLPASDWSDFVDTDADIAPSPLRKHSKSNSKSNSINQSESAASTRLSMNNNKSSSVAPSPDRSSSSSSRTSSIKNMIFSPTRPIKASTSNNFSNNNNNNNSTTSSFSQSSVPKVVLLGDLEINDKYFRGTFTPPVPSFLSLLDPPPATDSATHKQQIKHSKNKSHDKYHSLHTQLNGNSSILLNSHIQCLVEQFPSSVQNDAWTLLFSTALHGTDLASFYHRSAGTKYSLIVIRSADNQIFGGFATEPWKASKHGKYSFYGNGESFLFRCHPIKSDGDGDGVLENDTDTDTDNVDIFEWTYENYFFMWSNQRQIAMGGGGGQFGFVLDDDFSHAETNPCDTYGNPRLTSHTSPFQVAEVELWGFGSFIKSADAKRSQEHSYMMSYESS